MSIRVSHGCVTTHERCFFQKTRETKQREVITTWRCLASLGIFGLFGEDMPGYPTTYSLVVRIPINPAGPGTSYKTPCCFSSSTDCRKST